jgi:hypothetical protein
MSDACMKGFRLCLQRTRTFSFPCINGNLISFILKAYSVLIDVTQAENIYVKAMRSDLPAKTSISYDVLRFGDVFMIL